MNATFAALKTKWPIIKSKLPIIAAHICAIASMIFAGWALEAEPWMIAFAILHVIGILAIGDWIDAIRWSRDQAWKKASQAELRAAKAEHAVSLLANLVQELTGRPADLALESHIRRRWRNNRKEIPS